MRFEDMNLSYQLLSAIQKMGFDESTLIQERSIPLIVKGRDVIGESATGSGKTLAFGCSIVEHVIPQKGLQALVLTPTRELANQVKVNLLQLSQHKHLKIGVIYGGVGYEPQERDLERSDVIVATPGRFLDHMQRGNVDLSKVKILILDEADRMLEMGFIEDVEKIIRQCPKKRQTLFFSATISQQIRELAKRYMDNPERVTAKKYVDPSKLRQVYYNVQRNMKLSLLIHLLEHENSELVMVFCNSRKTVDFVTKNLKANRIEAIAIHGGLSQNKRNSTIETFNTGKRNVLVCTDVAARGLHIPNVSHIYNYDIPKDATDYVHRIGRTARAGEEGKVINLLSPEDHGNFYRVLENHPDFVIDKHDKPFTKKVNILRQQERKQFRSSQRRFFHRRF